MHSDFSPPEGFSLARVVTDVLIACPQPSLPDGLTTALGDTREPALVVKGAPLVSSGLRIVWANRAVSVLTGHDRDALFGAPLHVLWGPETSPRAQAYLSTALAAREAARIEMLNNRKDGRSYGAALDLAPLATETREGAYWLLLHHDVTAEREKTLRYETRHDPLTGLANRTALQERLQRLLSGAQTPASLLLPRPRSI